MDCRGLSLALVASVAYALGVVAALQIPIANISPCSTEFFDFGLLVPVGGGNGFAFVPLLFGVIYFVALLVKYVFLFLLRAPGVALLKWEYCQHDMDVGIAAAVSCKAKSAHFRKFHRSTKQRDLHISESIVVQQDFYMYNTALSGVVVTPSYSFVRVAPARYAAAATAYLPLPRLIFLNSYGRLQ